MLICRFIGAIRAAVLSVWGIAIRSQVVLGGRSWKEATAACMQEGLVRFWISRSAGERIGYPLHILGLPGIGNIRAAMWDARYPWVKEDPSENVPHSMGHEPYGVAGRDATEQQHALTVSSQLIVFMFWWRLITLLCIICHAINMNPAAGLFPPPSSPYHPSESSSPKHPVSCIKHKQWRQCIVLKTGYNISPMH